MFQKDWCLKRSSDPVSGEMGVTGKSLPAINCMSKTCTRNDESEEESEVRGGRGGDEDRKERKGRINESTPDSLLLSISLFI